MPFITFAWTTPALLAGAKTVIRQPWTEQKARQYRAGMLITAYDRSPRHGGRPLAILRLTSDPELQPLSDMTEADYEAEGWHWLHEHRDLMPRWITGSDFSPQAFDAWRQRPGSVWVVRFDVIALTVGAQGDQASEALAEARAAA